MTTPSRPGLAEVQGCPGLPGMSDRVGSTLVSDRAVGADRTRLRIAYVLGIYPALTETFVLREIGALRRRGLEILVRAVRRPVATQRALVLGTLVDEESCVYARPDSLPRHLVANLACMLRRPLRYFSAMRTFGRQAARLPPREGLQLLYHFFAGVGFSYDLRRAGANHLH